MRLQIVQDALKKKNIKYEYTEIDGCGSLDFLFRGLKFHVWEYEDRVWGAETNIYEAGRSQDIEGNYEEVIAKEILSWPDMMPGSCGSLDFLFRGLKFHVWEYEDRVWGAETNIYEAGRSQDIEGNYEEVIAKEILSWPDMMPGS